MISRKMWNLAASCCLLAALWAVMAWQGLGAAGKLAEQENNLQQLRAEYAALENLQREHPDVERYQLEVEREAGHVAKLLPDEMQAAAFWHDLKAAADRNGMVLQELVPEEAEAEKGLAVLPIKANLSGDYFALVRFLRSLQNGSRLVQVAGMDVASKGDLLACRLRLKIFSEKI
ncbi:MAG: type 4a pilus biogenesis protein PilO [Selenomonadaceae bacterium]|nr:type 4a pilus biogenesis protein PilO [Selenomonadaceae bacterium]